MPLLLSALPHCRAAIAYGHLLRVISCFCFGPKKSPQPVLEQTRQKRGIKRAAECRFWDDASFDAQTAVCAVFAPLGRRRGEGVGVADDAARARFGAPGVEIRARHHAGFADGVGKARGQLVD